jgi:hypothetical protein
MTHFQVPDDRVFNDAAAGRLASDPASGLQNWPEAPEGYRLFVTGSSGEERIGIHTGQKIELQLTGGNGYRIETAQGQQIRTIANATGQDVLKLAERIPSPVTISHPTASGDKHRFILAAKSPGVTNLYAMDGANNQKAILTVAAGNFEYHRDMKKDLIADICRSSDSLKILALQRMLHDRFDSEDPNTHEIFTKNRDDIFSQNSHCNWHPDDGNMTCGRVAKWRGAEVFDETAAVGFDWYTKPLHQPMYRKVRDRSDLKYRPGRIQNLVVKIKAALDAGKAVRLGVVDRAGRRL